LQEFACDEVLVNERQVSRSGYGNCLLEVASAAKGSTLLASYNMVPRFSLWQNNQQQLRRRILMLMKTEGT
jgi:beta-lactamase regulating signal transducer with metallopeptidase domain